MSEPLTDEQIEAFRAVCWDGTTYENIAEFIATLDALRERLAAAEEQRDEARRHWKIDMDRIGVLEAEISRLRAALDAVTPEEEQDDPPAS